MPSIAEIARVCKKNQVQVIESNGILKIIQNNKETSIKIPKPQGTSQSSSRSRFGAF
jgi:hypothetical protein